MNSLSTTHTLVTLLAVSVVLVSSPALAGGGKAYGEPLRSEVITPIADLFASPDDYVGKTVRVEGFVTGVCEKRGCWISLASGDTDFQEIRIKVDDGVIVFPMESMGKKATAEGVFQKFDLTMEQTLARAEHHAQEHGETFDPSQVTEPLTFLQIKATGAVIH